MALIDGIPNVPDFKGLVSAGTDALISFGGAALLNLVFGNKWGVFNQYGIPILLVDNVVSIKYTNSAKISNAPVEKGTFASYNKVSDPYKATVQMSVGTGGTFKRGAFLGQIETLSASTLKFHIVTPEYVYLNASITGYDMSREASDGAQLIKVNLHLEEIREVIVKYDIEEVANPDDAETKDSGEKQSADATENTSLLRKITDVFKNLFNRF